MSIRKKKAEAIIGGLMVDLAASGAFDALAIVRQANERSAPGSASAPGAPEDPAWAELSRELTIIKITVPTWSGAAERNAIRHLEYAIKSRTTAVPVLIERLDRAIDENAANYDDIQVAKDAIAKMKSAAKRIGGPAMSQEGGGAGAAEKAFDEYIARGAKELEAFFAKYQIEDDPKGEYWSEPHFNVAKRLLLDDLKVQRLVSHYNKKDEAKAKLIARPDFPQGAFELYKHVSAQIKKASSELDKLPSRI